LKKDDQLPGNIPFVMAGVTNNGVVNYISNPIAIFPKNSITIDIFGNTFYRDYDFGAGDDTGVYWNDNEKYSREVMLFFATAMRKALLGKFDFGNKLRSSKSLDFKMKLPIKDGEIDFKLIESYISAMEEEKIDEVDRYLSSSDLHDSILTPDEEHILELYKKDCLSWKEFNLEELLGKSTRGRRLKSLDRVSGELTFVTAGETEEGVSGFIGNNVRIFSQNTTTIDMFGSAKYRNYKYGCDDHIAVVHTESLPKYASIFVTGAIHKASHTGKFDYGRNFYAKDADELIILLPILNDSPDYQSMDTLISAVHKLVIQKFSGYKTKHSIDVN
jgi:hypothetical protein